MRDTVCGPILDWIWHWIVSLPDSLTEKSKYPFVRVVGLLIQFIWLFVSAPVWVPAMLIFGCAEMFEETWKWDR